MTRPTPATASFLAPPAPARSAELRAGKMSADDAMPASGAQTGFAANLETRLRRTADGAETTRSEAEFRLLKRKKQAQLPDPSGGGTNQLAVPGNFDDQRYHAVPVTTDKGNSAPALPAAMKPASLPPRTGAGSDSGLRQSAPAPAGKSDGAEPGTLNTDAKHEQGITETGAPDSAAGFRLSDKAGPKGARPNSNIEPVTTKETDRAAGSVDTSRANANADDPAGRAPGKSATQGLPTIDKSEGSAKSTGHDSAAAPSSQLAASDTSPSEPQASAKTDAGRNPALANEPITTSVIDATPTTGSTQATGAGGTPASRGPADSANRGQVAGSASVAPAAPGKNPITTKATPAPEHRGPAARTEGPGATARSTPGSTTRPQRAATDRTRPAQADAASGERAATIDKAAESKAAAATSAARPLATDPTQSDALSPVEMTRISDTPDPADTPAQDGELAAIETPLDPALVSEEFQGELGDRLVQAIRLDMNNAEIRITPEDLGPIRIDLNMDGDTANISFSADHGATRQALHDSMHTLRDMLSSEGWTLGQTDVRDNPGNGHMADRRSAPGDGRGSRNGSATQTNSEAAVHESRYLPPRRPQSLVDLFA